MRIALFWMAGSISFFSLMAVGARELSDELPVIVSLFFRSLIGIMLVSACIIATGNLKAFRTERPKIHILRNLFHLGGQYGWFVGIGLLPMAQVIALEFTVPVWTTLIAAVVLKETITARKLLAVLLGLTGVGVIVAPELYGQGSNLLDSASLYVLAAALGYAICHIATKSLSGSEPSIRVVFYMCAVQMPIALLGALPVWVWPHGEHWLWLCVISCAALLAHLCLTNALRAADVASIMVLDFLRLPAAALIGVLFYMEQPTWALMMGATLMIAGNSLSLKPIGWPTLFRHPTK